MGVGVNVDVMSTLIFHRAFCYSISALVPQDASMSFELVEMDGVFSWIWCTMVSRSLACLCRFMCWGIGCYFLFAIAHQHCLLRYGCVHLSKQQQFPLARLYLWNCWCLSCSTYCGDFVGLRVVDSSSNRLRSIFFVCDTTPMWRPVCFS